MKNNWQLLYNPFTKIAGWRAFFIGLPIVCLTVILGWLTGTAAYGLEIKTGEFSLGEGFLATGTGLACTIVVMYLIGLIFSKGVRFQDIAGTVVLARAPYILSPLLGLAGGGSFGNEVTEAVRTLDLSLIDWGQVIWISILSLAVSVWAIAMLWNAFRISTNLKGAKAVLLFILALLLSEIIMLAILW